MNIAELLSNLRTPKIFREIITLFGGIGFLLILWIFQLRYLNFDFGIHFNQLESDFVLLIIAYLAGKTLLFLTHILDIVRYFLDRLSSPKTIKYRDKIKEFFSYRFLLNHPINADELEHEITEGEVWKELSKHQLFEEAIERDFQARLFARFFFAYAFLGLCYSSSILASFIFAGLTLFFAFAWYDLDRRIFISWIDFQKHIVKEGHRRAREKEPAL